MEVEVTTDEEQAAVLHRGNKGSSTRRADGRLARTCDEGQEEAMMDSRGDT